jgi:hypothetical protein
LKLDKLGVSSARGSKKKERVKKAKRLSTVAVVDEKVGAAVKGASDAVRDSKLLDAVGDGSRGGEVLETLEVDGETDNVGGGHGSSAERGSGGVATDVGRDDADTGAEDVNTGTVVGEGSGAEARVGGGDSQGVRGVGGRLARDG